MATLQSPADLMRQGAARQGSSDFFLGRVSCALAIFAALMASTTPSPLYQVYITQWQLPQSAGTTIFATYAIGTLLSLLLSGWLDARTSDRRQILLPALIVTACGALLFAVASQVWMLLVARFMSGFSTGLITSTASAAIFALSPGAQKARAATISTIAFTGGAAAGPCLSSAALATHFAPLVSPFICIALFAAVAFLGLSLSSWPRQSASSAATTRSTGPEVAPALRRNLFVLSCLAIATAWMLGSLLMAMGVTLATDLFGLQIHALAGLLPAIFQLFAGLGQMLSSRLKPLNAILAGTAVLALLQLMTLGAALGGLTAFFILAMPLCGLFYGAAFVGGASLVNATSAPETLARRIATFYVVGYLSNAVPTYIMGLLVDRFGLSSAFEIFTLAFVIFGLVAATMALVLRRRLARAI
ncbi:MFS transporter [Pseudooceanicola sp. GBMRC 2024]|uniref:MFS transporter n=1 Tax=Pseudooceanicola albus TaxID=2692189 RepID=A0A6L7G343_9RHOB|nr:MFS transporter [Pseudooceanicola albus]MXN17846.1 MFS transporter [Pseudooceanicola albus]